ncbi:MAG: DUF5680 domain-containing protein [Sarcina sp.]
MDFGKRLRNIRVKNNLSQEQLGELLNVSRQAISKWEVGETYPEVDKLIYISNKFGVTLDYLVKGEKSNCYNIEPTISTVDLDALKEFLIKAKKLTYASGENKALSSRPNSYDLAYEEGDFKYIDTYLGSKNFIGEEALWMDNKPYWAMNYSGRVLCDKFSGSFLKEVLSKVEVEKPYRGPMVYVKGDYTYQCMVEGEFEWFNGKEEIFLNNEKIYECIFHGGIVQ